MQPDSNQIDLLKLDSLFGELLQSSRPHERKGNVLVIGNRALPSPENPDFLRDEHTFGLALRLIQGKSQPENHEHKPLQCDSSVLPFQDDVFHSVILYLVTADGLEAEFHEACRVLAPVGELLILGINRRSWSGVKVRGEGPVPVMDVAKVRKSLHAEGFVIAEMQGRGLMGWSRPSMAWNRISALALPLADLILLRAKHREQPVATRLRVKKYPARVMSTGT